MYALFFLALPPKIVFSLNWYVFGSLFLHGRNMAAMLDYMCMDAVQASAAIEYCVDTMTFIRQVF